MTSTPGEFLLDTNIVVALLNGEAAAHSHLLMATSAFVPVAVFGELYFGAAKSGRPAYNVAPIESLAEDHKVIECNLAVAREYGKIREELRRKGRPIPENDVWIAATARHYHLTLVTRDRHFKEIEGLHTADWATPPPSAVEPQ